MVRYGKGHKEESRLRIVAAAGRGFRKLGYGGIGVDGLAREANVTHGAFYGHFRSKAEAFRAAVVSGLRELREAVAELRSDEGKNWLSAFAAFYVGYKRVCEIGEACTLPTLSPEIERADVETRLAYQGELTALVETVVEGLPEGPDREARAYAIMALLAGGVTLARAVPDQVLSEKIAAAVRGAAALLQSGKLAEA